jgi:hypothetical protein
MSNLVQDSFIQGSAPSIKEIVCLLGRVHKRKKLQVPLMLKREEIGIFHIL